MKKRQGIMVCGILAMIFCLPAEPGEALTKQDIVQGNSSFAWDLYARLRVEDGNLFFSPYSISLALAMTYAGADGETAAQMASTLHFSGSRKEFHPAVASLSEHVKHTAEAEGLELQIANSLWPNTSLQLVESFIETTRQHYKANLFSVDFVKEARQSRQKINTWVSDNTMRKIPELLRPDDITVQTVLALVNAIYFKGDWETPFKAEATTDASFAASDGTVTVAMMHQQGDFDYAEGDGLRVLGLPYAGRSFYMVVFLPDEPNALGRLETSLDKDFVLEWIDKLQPRKVKVAFPQFTLRERFSLLETLEKMGMRNVSDFSDMAQPSPFLSKVVHEAYIDVNEQGTEAAAATAAVMSRSLPRYIEFTADHPFVFCIFDASSESVLFIGRVVNPTK